MLCWLHACMHACCLGGFRLHACMRKDMPPRIKQPARLTSDVEGATAVQDRHSSAHEQGVRRRVGRDSDQGIHTGQASQVCRATEAALCLTGSVIGCAKAGGNMQHSRHRARQQSPLIKRQSLRAALTHGMASGTGEFETRHGHKGFVVKGRAVFAGVCAVRRPQG